MSSFTFPAAYRRYVERQLASMLHEVRRDHDYRADNDERIRSFAPIATTLVDSDRAGAFMVVVGAPQSTLAPLPSYGTHAAPAVEDER